MNHELALELLYKYEILTTYTETFLKEGEPREHFSDIVHFEENPPPRYACFTALALYWRLKFYGERIMPLRDFWSQQTLLNLITMNPQAIQSISQAIIDRRFSLKKGTLQSLALKQLQAKEGGKGEILQRMFGHSPSAEDVLISYVEHTPTREDLLTLIREYIVEKAPIVQYAPLEEPTNALFSGLFFAKGFARQEAEIDACIDVRWIPVEGNMQYIAEEDWGKLALIYNLPEKKFSQENVSLIIEEQRQEYHRYSNDGRWDDREWLLMCTDALSRDIGVEGSNITR